MDSNQNMDLLEKQNKNKDTDLGDDFDEEVIKK